MIPVEFKVSRSKVKVKGHIGLQHLVQPIGQERFAPEASNLVVRKSLMSRWPLSIGERTKVNLFLICWGRGGGISVSQTSIFLC